MRCNAKKDRDSDEKDMQLEHLPGGRCGPATFLPVAERRVDLGRVPDDVVVDAYDAHTTLVDLLIESCKLLGCLLQKSSAKVQRGAGIVIWLTCSGSLSIEKPEKILPRT